MSRLIAPLALCASLVLAALSVGMLEAQSRDLAVEEMRIEETPVSLYLPQTAGPAPLVVIAHGYGGSRQMMRPLALTLARAGFATARFDFHGHGDNPRPMTGDVTAIEGTTEQLVRQTLAVTEALLMRPDLAGPAALIGHSMATDIVIRAAERRADDAAVIAISMYSDAVTESHPARLLVISGAYEDRLREIAMDRVRLVDPRAAEGDLVQEGAVERRAIAAPLAGHVGVLYAPTTLQAARDWLGASGDAPLPRHGLWLVLLLAAVLGAAWPLSRLIVPDNGESESEAPQPLRTRQLWAALLVPAPLALGAAAIVPADALGLAGFGQMTAFFGIWGAAQAGLLWLGGARGGVFSSLAFAVMLIWGLGCFALALDRYGAAFLPGGPRLGAAALLALGTIPFCLGSALLARAARWPLRVTAKILVLATLLAMLFIVPGTAPAFTVLPVLVLFWGVYGSVALIISARGGALAPGAALGLILAWALGASTPLIAA